MEIVTKNFKRQETDAGLDKFQYEDYSKIVTAAIFISYLNWVVAVVLPLAYWNSATKDGYPWDPHIIFAIYCALVAIFEIFAVVTMNPARLFSSWDYSCFCGFGWTLRVIFDLLTGVLSRGDVYTDGTFIVVVYHTPDSDLFLPAITMYMLGVVFFQCVIEGMALGCQVDTPLKSLDVRANFTFRYGDLNLLMDIAGIQGEENAAVREFFISACRFCCEDISQTIIQVMFLLEPHESNENRDLVTVSIVIAILLSATKFASGAKKMGFCPNIPTPF